MRQPVSLTHKFVKSIPDKLEEQTLYISMEYSTVVHKCCCGCDNEVVTPLSLTDWKLTYDGVSVSLFPSIGNWSFDCQSHYWIENSTAKWAGQWTPAQIQAGRTQDRRLKEKYYGGQLHPTRELPKTNATPTNPPQRNDGPLSQILKWWRKN